MSSPYDWLLSLCDPAADPAELARVAQECVAAGDLHHAATACDVAYGLDPTNTNLAGARAQLLDHLALVEHGLRFRYIPGGTFLMGSPDGDPDERPVHPVQLEPYWLTEMPVSWTDYCRLLGWSPPPDGQPQNLPVGEGGFSDEYFRIRINNQIRLQYCETETTRAVDWHAHDPNQVWLEAGVRKTAQELFGSPPRRNPEAPWTWDQKPMVAVSWQDAMDLVEHLAAPGVQYALPTEAEWERAARGGLGGKRYAWGDEPPTPERCDCNRWNEFFIRLPRELPPNGYGLYGMSGGVWEWTADRYDACYYREGPCLNPGGPATGEEHVLRGGSWTDCPEAVTVSFRMSLATRSWREKEPSRHHTPNIGFRLARRSVLT